MSGADHGGPYGPFVDLAVGDVGGVAAEAGRGGNRGGHPRRGCGLVAEGGLASGRDDVGLPGAMASFTADVGEGRVGRRAAFARRQGPTAGLEKPRDVAADA